MKFKPFLLFICILHLFLPLSLYAQDFSQEGEIVLFLDTGIRLPIFGSSVTGAATADIPVLFDFNRLIDIINVNASVNDRFFLSIDYDSVRGDFPEAGNNYNLLYQGKYHEALKWISLGNLHQTIEGTDLVEINPGSSNGIALKGVADINDLHLETLLRYDNVSRKSKTWIGRREYINISPPDTGFIQRRYYHLPDTAIDPGSLELYKTSQSGAYVIDGKSCRLLIENEDFTIDYQSGWIYLEQTLQKSNDLFAYYSKGGVSLGENTLGTSGYIEADGLRTDFNLDDYPDQFGESGGVFYLYLQKAQSETYWQLDNAYYLPGVSTDNSPEGLGITLRSISTGTVNDNYSSITANIIVYNEHGAVFFYDEDASGFYPRPFPGEFQFSHPSTPDNPFNPLNPVYGELGSRSPYGEFHYLDISYTLETEEYFLSYFVLPESVVVTVDGKKLSNSQFVFDSFDGSLVINDGVASESSVIKITWSEGNSGIDSARIFGASIFTLPFDDSSLKFTVKTDIPSPRENSPRLSDHHEAESALDIRYSWQDGEEDDPEWMKFSMETAAYLKMAGISGRTIINGMDENNDIDLGLGADDWMTASLSTFLPAAASLTLGDRGDLMFRNYYSSDIFELSQLTAINSAIPPEAIFPYSDKSGPYNTSDISGYGSDQTLVLDYFFQDGDSDPFVSISKDMSGMDFSSVSRFEIILRHQDLVGVNPYVYVEILDSFQEDINDNDILDGESSIGSQGFIISPQGGNPTVIGTYPNGLPNGSIESEDQNGNGILDQPRIWDDLNDIWIYSDESGRLIQDGVNDYIYQLNGAEDTWTTVSVEIDDPEFWQNAKALRITIAGISGAITGDSSGRLMINSIRFKGLQVQNNSPAETEVYMTDDYLETSSTLESSFPEIYAELYGSQTLRDREGHLEKVLHIELSQNLPASDSVSISIPVYPHTDFNMYNALSFFIYRPAAVSLPSDSSFFCIIEDSYSGSSRVDIPSNLITSGWNLVELGFDGAVIINNTESVVVFNPASLQSVYNIKTGLQAGSTIIPSGSYFILDELHLKGLNPSLGYSATANFNSYYEYPVFLFGSFNFMDRLGTYAEIKHTGIITENYRKPVSVNFIGGINSRFAELIPFGIETGLGHESQTDIHYTKNDYVFKQSAGFQAEEQKNLPEINIEYHGINTDTSLEQKNLGQHSLDFTGKGKIDTLFNYNYQYLRSWQKNPGADFTSASGTHKINFSLATEVLRSRISFTNNTEYNSASLAISDPWTGWGYAWRSMFLGNIWLENDSVYQKKSDQLQFSINVPPEKMIGFDNYISFSFKESRISDVYKNANVNESIKIGVPFSFYDGDFLFQPSWVRTSNGQYSQAAWSRTEAELLSDLIYGFWYNPFPRSGILSPPAAAAGSVYSRVLDLSSVVIKDLFIFNFLFRKPEWYIPSSFQVQLAQDGSFNGYSYTGLRSISGTVNKKWNKVISPKDMTSVFVKLNGKYEQNLHLLNETYTFGANFDFQRRNNDLITDIIYSGKYLGYFHNPDLPVDSIISSMPAFNPDSTYNCLKSEINNRLVFSISWKQHSKKTDIGKLPPDFLENLDADELQALEEREELIFGLFNLIEHREKIAVESTWKAGTQHAINGTSRVPIIITLEHSSTLFYSDFLDIEIILRLKGGSEQRYYNEDYIDYNSIGAELSVKGHILF